MIVATCPVENYDQATGTCSQVVYVEQEGLLPSLSVADSFFYSSLIISAWCVGFGFKLIRKFIFR